MDAKTPCRVLNPTDSDTWASGTAAYDDNAVLTPYIIIMLLTIIRKI